MLAPPLISSYGFSVDNWPATPSASFGTSVVPGASNAEGSWTQVIAAANLTRNVYWIKVIVSNGFTASTIKDHLLDLGVDTAGGSSYTAIISNIVCGSSSPIMSSAGGVNPLGGFQFLIPCFIPAGSSLAARIQGVAATAGTVRIGIKLFGDPTAPETMPVGQYSETIGTISSSSGVSFTPGSAADGAWVQLGTTVKDMWWWQLCVQLSNAAYTNVRGTYVDLAYGDATNKFTIVRELYQEDAIEALTGLFRPQLNLVDCYCPLPGGTNLYVRGRCSAAPATGWNAVAVGIGG